MDLFTWENLKTLLAPTEGPCVSIYLPTHRGGSEQDGIGWRNLLREADKLLEAAGQRATQTRALLKPARQLLEDAPFWQALSDGLACFLAPRFFRSYRLPLTFEARAVTASRFHVKPLLPLLSGDGRFYVLAISQKQVRLLQGTHYGVQELDLHGLPASLAEALRFHDVDEPLVFHTRPVGAGRWSAIFHGHGVGIDDAKDDLLRYFRMIDRGLHEFLRKDHVPLVLAGVEYLWPIYRQANTYPHLLPEGIAGNPDRLSARELHALAWPIVVPRFHQVRARAVALFQEMSGHGYASTTPKEILPAAFEGRIEVLFVAVGREQWGTFDRDSLHVVLHEQREPTDEDLLNVAAMHTLLHGGTVYPVPPEEMPAPNALAAAVFWLPAARRPH